jgi:general secretion pathway protein D
MMTRSTVSRLVIILVAVALVAGCAAARSYRQGQAALRAGDWDAAVVHFRRALQEDPDKPEYKIALERASSAASRAHFDRARELEAKDQLDLAAAAYKKAAEFDPSNRQAALNAAELEKTVRARIEAARPRPPIEQMRDRARQASQPPMLNPASREPIDVRFVSASIRDILSSISATTGINITYDKEAANLVSQAYTIDLRGVTIEQALNQVLSANNLFYKVVNDRTIIVIPDTPQKRAQYEEQVIRTFYISHADVQELSQLISLVIRTPQIAVQPLVAINKSANAITVRATTAVADVIEEIIRRNDKPRAEIIVDVEILEVNRGRVKQFGLNLSEYSLGFIFSPEVAPGAAGGTATGPPPFNLNTVSQGVSTADFYGTVPTAVIRFLETDSRTRLLAKPQLRGQEGAKLTLNLGDEIPVPSTTFTPLAAGGATFNPLTSFSYKPVGINIEVTPRVSYEGDVILELLVESSTLGQSIDVAGQLLPSFGSRKATAKLRLRDGESTLLAGLLREEDRREAQGFPGVMRVPLLRALFGGNRHEVAQTDIVMLLTPRVIRTHEITQRELSPIFIGTQQNIGLTGPPPLIAPQPESPAAPPPGETVPPPAPVTPPGTAAPGARPGVPTPPAGAPAGVPTAPPLGAQPGVPGAPTGPTQPGTTPAPGVVTQPQVPPAETPPAAATPATTPPAATPPATPTPGAQIVITPPGTEFRVGGGPYTVPISINGANRLSTVTITLTYNPAVLRASTLQEGSFMRQGGVNATFTHQTDATAGRIDFTLTRTADAVGATGAGLLAVVLFEAAAPGSATLTPSGAATMPNGASVPLQFSPVTITVR